MMSSAESVKKVRNALCLQQKEFAELLKITKSAVSYYEKGRIPSRPILRRILAIAKENNIDVTIEDFLED